MADAASERQPGDAGRADDPSRGGEAEGLGRRVEVEPRHAARGACEPRIGVDRDGTHRREVDHDAVVADAVPGRVVAASAYGDLALPCAGEVEGRRDVGRARAARDQHRPAVDQGVVAAPRGVVFRVSRLDDVAGE
jgi:hypothetical protein